MKKAWFVIVVFVTIGILYALSLYLFANNQGLISPIAKQKPLQKPLLAYTFVNLKKISFPKSQITLGPEFAQTPASLSQMFYYDVPKTPTANATEKVSGVVNIPKAPGTYPVIVMFRGFVPTDTYTPGIGTQPAAQFFAQHGFITLAPDFLGYGESASASADDFENRFQTYTTALTLLSSLSTLNTALFASYSGTITFDPTKIGLWGHSNGGHILLSTLAISGVTYPSVAWAPVSTPFPYSILYYTDDTDDHGKALRKALAQFEEIYDTEAFSPTNYYQWIKAPMEIDQGTLDESVPFWWSDTLVATLKKDNVSVTYQTYPGADHNFLPNGWTSAVNNDLLFYNSHFTSS